MEFLYNFNQIQKFIADRRLVRMPLPDGVSGTFALRPPSNPPMAPEKLVTSPAPPPPIRFSMVLRWQPPQMKMACLTHCAWCVRAHTQQLT